MQQVHVRISRDTSSGPLLGAAKTQRFTAPSVRGGGKQGSTCPPGSEPESQNTTQYPPQISQRMDANLALFQVEARKVRFLLKESGSMDLDGAAETISANQACSANLVMSKGQNLWCLSGDPLIGPPSHLCPDSSSCQCKQSPARGRRRDHKGSFLSL